MRNRGRPAPPRPQPPRPTSPATAPAAQSVAPLPAASSRGPADTGPLPLRKDQQRALKAYEWADAAQDVLADYQIAVQSFAAALLRSGFCRGRVGARTQQGSGGSSAALDRSCGLAPAGDRRTAGSRMAETSPGTR